MLDEIAGRLSDIYEQLISQVPEGSYYTIPFSVLAPSMPIIVVLPFSATIYNDGPADIYITDENRVINPLLDAPLKSGESISFEFRQQGDHPKHIQTIAGAATGRVHCLR